MRSLVVGPEPEEDDMHGRVLDVERLSTLLASLPALTTIGYLVLRADMHCRPTAAAVQAFLAEAARAIGRCSSLQHVRLGIVLLGRLPNQLPEEVVRELAGMRSLVRVTLRLQAWEADRLDWPATFSLAHLAAGLACLTRLRALSLSLFNVSMEATLPACVSCLAQLTSLSLCGVDGLRCAPGWACLPALVRLDFHSCVFAGDGEAVLPGMDALVSLASLQLWGCPSLRLLPASLWRLTQLRHLLHRTDKGSLAGMPRSALPVAGLPLGAPCFASMVNLSLAGHNLAIFPPGILAMSRLRHLDLSHCCFEQLPVGVSALSALTGLRLGRHSGGATEVGGSFDARALGTLASFPNLRGLEFSNCRVLACSDFQAAAAHPRLERLQLDASYPAPGPSSGGMLAFVTALLQQGRSGVLVLTDSVVEGAGQQDSRNFRAALRLVGYPLSEADSFDLV